VVCSVPPDAHDPRTGIFSHRGAGAAGWLTLW
jgi:hypothetical protein